MKVCFAIPTYTGDMRCETFKNLMEAVLMLKELNIETDLLILANCPVISVARNTLEAMFMADPDATDLFFLDSDVGFDPIAVVKLLQRPEEIIAGAYRVKVDDHEEFSVVIKHEKGVPKGKVISQNPPLAIVEADFLATGFMRIKRTVLEKMRLAYPGLRYKESVIKTVNRTVTEAYDLFGMGIDDTRDRYTTEDYMFCKRWRDIGGQLWIYPDIEFDHIGRKAYSGNFHKHLMNRGLTAVKLTKALETPGWMNPEELTWLAEQAKRHTRIVEMGSAFGRSTRALADNTAGTVWAIDDWLGPRDWKCGEDHSVPKDEREAVGEGFPLFMADHLESGKVVQVKTDHANQENFPAIKPDLVFIDGDHSYEAVKRDIEYWLKRVPKGAILSGHDFSWDGVTKAVNELLPGAVVIPGTDIWCVEISK